MLKRAFAFLPAAGLVLAAACSAVWQGGHVESSQVEIDYDSGRFDSSSGKVSFGSITIRAKDDCLEDVRIEYLPPEGEPKAVLEAPGRFIRLQRYGACFDVGEEAGEQETARFRIVAKDCKTKKDKVLIVFEADEHGISRVLSLGRPSLRFAGSEEKPHVIAVGDLDQKLRWIWVRDLRDVPHDPLRVAYPPLTGPGDLAGALVLVDGVPFLALPGSRPELRVPAMPGLKAKVEIVTFDTRLVPGLRADISEGLR